MTMIARLFPMVYVYVLLAACIPDALFALFSWLGLQTRTHILVSSLVISWSITEVCMLLNPDNLGITALQNNCVIEPRDAAIAVIIAEDVKLN